MKINPIGGGRFPKFDKAAKVVATMIATSTVGTYLLIRKDKKK